MSGRGISKSAAACAVATLGLGAVAAGVGQAAGASPTASAHTASAPATRARVERAHGADCLAERQRTSAPHEPPRLHAQRAGHGVGHNLGHHLHPPEHRLNEPRHRGSQHLPERRLDHGTRQRELSASGAAAASRDDVVSRGTGPYAAPTVRPELLRHHPAHERCVTVHVNGRMTDLNPRVARCRGGAAHSSWRSPRAPAGRSQADGPCAPASAAAALEPRRCTRASRRTGRRDTTICSASISGPRMACAAADDERDLRMPAGINFTTTTLGLAICQPAALRARGLAGCSPTRAWASAARSWKSRSASARVTSCLKSRRC